MIVNDWLMDYTHLSQIYNETIRDLLNPAAGYLELREDSKGTAVVTGVTEVKTTSIRDVRRHQIHPLY